MRHTMSDHTTRIGAAMSIRSISLVALCALLLGEAAAAAQTDPKFAYGTKEEQALNKATLLRFAWQPAVARADYLLAQMAAADGPYDTHDYLLLAEAVPVDSGHTLLHMGYAFSHGTASSLAMNLYLGTVGRDKVGFTRNGKGFVDGRRGVVERNTMRYYLAIDAYLRSLAAPPAARLEQRLHAWYDATEKYPRQLHEVDKDDYLRMKRNEVARQSAP